jgi:hypothetical protein
MRSKWTLERLVGGGVEWIHLAYNQERWPAVVNAVMKLGGLGHGFSYLVCPYTINTE